MSAVKKTFVVESLRRAQMSDVLSKGKRLNGRGFQDYRELIVETGVIREG